MDRSEPKQTPISDVVRDDNLRLLFSEAAKRELAERLKAIELGFVILAVSVLLALTAWVFRLIGTAPETGRSLFESFLEFDKPQDFMISIVLLSGAIVTTLSPIILGMLVIERRRCRRDMKDLLSLLRRYDRH
ncbi:MAG: hypothetical protein NWR87_06000 [Rhodospirillales bacterium]|jgi:hypothetical protein|nr:hypothetical protein [Rhodospirillales bacterium]